ncbi:chymotrypsin-like protease CTRL-1 isoform X1 [Ixodes scapularis]|nr:chymotrypsin-like protease CTRL-1 isoform X1 [Ixodes scapularis]
MKAIICLTLLVGSAVAHYTGVCGNPKIKPRLAAGDRIEGGEEAVPGSWPWHAQLIGADGHHACSGVLISDKHVLTAAKCLWRHQKVGDVKVMLGSHTRDGKSQGQVTTTIAEACLYKGYDGGHDSNIAILTLKEKVPLGDYIQPACMPKSDAPVPKDLSLYVTGWDHDHDHHDHHDHDHEHGHDHAGDDLTSGLKQARVKSVENNACYNEHDEEVPNSVFCTVYDVGSPCKHDLGAPVVGKLNNLWTLYGVVSGGAKGCKVGEHPILHTRVALFTKLIDDYTHGKKGKCDIKV